MSNIVDGSDHETDADVIDASITREPPLLESMLPAAPAATGTGDFEANSTGDTGSLLSDQASVLIPSTVQRRHLRMLARARNHYFLVRKSAPSRGPCPSGVARCNKTQLHALYGVVDRDRRRWDKRER